MADGQAGFSMDTDTGVFDKFFKVIFGDDEPKSTADNTGRRSHCVGEAIENAKIWQSMTGHPTKIAISNIINTDKENMNHSQAVDFSDENNLVPLTAHKWDQKNNRPLPEKWDWHFPDKKPHSFVDVDTFLNEQEKNLDPDYVKYLRSIK